MRLATLSLTFALTVACNPAVDDTGPEADTDTDTDASGGRSLATCGGIVDDDVPDFYKTWFKCTDISMDGDTVVIWTEGLPPHDSYYWGEGDENYAEFDYSRGDDYHPNPNVLSAQSETFRIPANPVSKGLAVTDDMVDTTVNTSDEEYSGGPVGVAIDSVLIFNDQAGPGDDINDEKYTFDGYNGHPAQRGDYHYHTTTPGPLEVSEAIGQSGVELYGVLCDGAVVLGCTELDGSAASDADFDAQNGHTHDISDGTTTHFSDRYHTHVCDSFTGHLFMPEIQVYTVCE